MNITFKRCISLLLCTAVISGIVPGTVSAGTETDSSSFLEGGIMNSNWSPSFSLETEKQTEIEEEEENDVFASFSEEAATLKLPEDAEKIFLEISPITHINPLYADILTEEDLVQSSGIAVIADEEIEYHTSAESAGNAIRDMLEARTETISVGYCIDVDKYDILDEPALKKEAADIFSEACEHTGVPTEGDYMRWQYGGYYIHANGSVDDEYYYLVITFTPTYYTTAEQEEMVDAAVDELLVELDLDGCSDYEIVKSVYDWICANVTYDNDTLEDDSYKLKYTAYAALFDRTCVCQGYALLMYRLLLENNIDCRLIAGDGGGPHAWNIVELDDFYYNVDATWDAGNAPEEYEWFLLNQDSFERHVRYNNADYGYYDSPEFHAAYPMAEENYFSSDDIRTSGTLDEKNGITWTFTPDGTLTISGKGAMPGFAQKTDDGMTMSTEFLPWGSLRSKIVKIVVESGITSLGDGAFFSSYAAVTAEIADTVKEIGEMAFSGCHSLEKIYFCKTVPTIDSYTFSGVTATLYYPAGYSTWTETVSKTYGGEITWKELEFFEISDVDDLYLFAKLVNGGHVYLDAELLNDLTVNEAVLSEDGFPDVENREFRVWTPIGNLNSRYLGNFDGGGHTVSGLFFYDSSVSDVGFFGYMGQNATNGYIGCIENLTVADSYFNGRGAGGIAAANGGGTIQNCINHSTIISSDGAGGITSYSDGPLLDCVNTGIVRGKAAVGGIAGQILDSDISRCQNSGEVTSFKGSVGSGISVGGIVGLKAQSGTISYCTNLGAITGVTDVGGIAGTHERDRVINCLNSGSVTGTSSVGGISGYLRYGSVQNCFDNGTGSIFGSCSSGTLSSCYYLADSETDSQSGTTAVNLKRCRSGEVAFLLGSAWGQTIGREDFPVLNGMKVYKTTEESPCPGYTNNTGGIKEHKYEDGICKWCGTPEFTADNYDVNGDGEITTDDVLYLLRYTILPGRYPLASGFDADFDGDGFVTAKDAVSLLNSIGSTETP